MKKSKKSSLYPVELTLYTLLFIFVSSCYLEQFVDQIANSALIFLIVGIVSSLALLYFIVKKREIFLNYRSVLLISTFYSLIHHFESHPADGYGLQFFIFIPVLLFASLKKLHYFLVTLILFAVSEYLRFTPLPVELGIVVHTGNPDYLLALYVVTIGITIFLITPEQKVSIPTKRINLPKENLENAQVKEEKKSEEKKSGEESDEKKGESSADEIEGDELSSVVFFMRKNFQAYSALGFIFNPELNGFVLNAFHSKSLFIKKNAFIPAGEGVIGGITKSKKTFISGSLSNYETSLPYYTKNESIHSLLAVPIMFNKDELYGVLVIDSADKLAFRETHHDIMNRFSDLAGALIHNIKMRVYQEKSALQFQTFYKAANTLAQTHNISDVFDTLISTLKSLIEFNRISIVTIDEDKKCLYVKCTGENSMMYKNKEIIAEDRGLINQVLERQQAITVVDFNRYREKYHLFNQKEADDLSTQSLIIHPFTPSDDKARFIILIEDRGIDSYNNDTLQIVSIVINSALIAYDKASLYQRMEKLATTDGLTQLYNHRTFQEILQKEIECGVTKGSSTSLLLMDIDHFKKFNDTYGHTIGDLVLKHIAACIKNTVSQRGTPARYGGEEFTVILPNNNTEQAADVAEQIRSNIEKLVIPSNSGDLKVTVSIGVATIPYHTSEQKELINFADAALYHSKEKGRNCVSIYNSSIAVKDAG